MAFSIASVSLHVMRLGSALSTHSTTFTTLLTTNLLKPNRCTNQPIIAAGFHALHLTGNTTLTVSRAIMTTERTFTARSKSQIQSFTKQPKQKNKAMQMAPVKSATFEELIESDKDISDKKISNRASADALFKEALDEIRTKRREIESDITTEPSSEIEKLTQDELEITRKILKRVDPEKEIAPQLESLHHYIDPYWDPFAKVEKLKSDVAYEFNEYSKLVSAAEARRQRLYIKRSLSSQYEQYDPLSRGAKAKHRRSVLEEFPVPHRMEERFWDPSTEVRVILKNNNRPFSWRDTHILHHFVAENGLILPRRVTYATRRQQRQVFKSICTARSMGVFPLDWKPTDAEKMPIMEPVQFLADELTQRYIVNKDRRAQAMLKVLVDKYPNVNVLRYFLYEAHKNQRSKNEKMQQEEEESGDFSRLLDRYRRLRKYKVSAPPFST